jgi:hypothetical protein
MSTLPFLAANHGIDKSRRGSWQQKAAVSRRHVGSRFRLHADGVLDVELVEVDEHGGGRSPRPRRRELRSRSSSWGRASRCSCSGSTGSSTTSWARSTLPRADRPRRRGRALRGRLHVACGRRAELEAKIALDREPRDRVDANASRDGSGSSCDCRAVNAYCVHGDGTPSCRQIARAMPAGISRWRGDRRAEVA